MIINNPDYTNTIGMVRSEHTNIGGSPDVTEYSENEKNNITNPVTQHKVQKDVYDLPTAKQYLYDIGSNLSKPKEDN